jgi:hypothetical protein
VAAGLEVVVALGVVLLPAMVVEMVKWATMRLGAAERGLVVRMRRGGWLRYWRVWNALRVGISPAWRLSRDDHIWFLFADTIFSNCFVIIG